MALPQSDEQDSLRKIDVARRLMEAGEHAEALVEAQKVLDDNFDEPLALFVCAMSLLKTKRYGMAYNLFRRVTQLQPAMFAPWNNMGMCHQETWNLDDAEKCFRESLKRHPKNIAALQNMALIYINRCMPDEALRWIERVEALGGEMTHEHIDNKAMALLMKRDWSGWELYRQTVGTTKQRELRAYNTPEEPMWHGEKGSVVIYGNQGLGDEIAFASCIPDAIEKADVIVDCDHRLAGLFKRSFPQAKVYGTRHKADRPWDHLIDYSIPSDCLPAMFRTKDKDFPGTPYLKADPERRIQWKALFDTYKKPVIGIAWTGGSKHTGKVKRSLSLEKLLPIFKSVDATWVSLEYNDRAEQIEEFEMEHGVKIHDFPRATRAAEEQDYDELAALVSELDLVISVTTAVVHLCGALGKECWTLVPNKPRWFLGVKGEDLPWYRSVKLLRQSQQGQWPIEELTKKLRLRYGDLDVHRASERLRELARP
jgi:hypothetical protein